MLGELAGVEYTFGVHIKGQTRESWMRWILLQRWWFFVLCYERVANHSCGGDNKVNSLMGRKAYCAFEGIDLRLPVRHIGCCIIEPK